MPSSQAPSAGATALDPTAVRPDIADARILRVTPDDVRRTLEGLRADGFTMLLDLGAVDYLEREPARFDVVYHLLRLPEHAAGVDEIGTPQRVRVLCGVRAEATAVPTVTDLWASADWAEREVYDLFGITFTGHPDLRRIQMPDDWEGHPLRKDYPLRGVARERTPRPSFALKSNVAAGTPAAGRTAAGLQRQIATVRRQADAHAAAEGAAAAQSGTNPGGAVTAAAATAGQLGAQPVNLKTEDGKPQ